MSSKSIKVFVCILTLGVAFAPLLSRGEELVDSSKPVEFRQWVAGQTVTRSVILTHDIRATGKTAIVLGADNIVLDCAGHTISGDGTGNGVESIDHTGVTITNCMIESFEKGIFLASTDGRKEELLSVDNVVRDNTLTANENGVFLMWSHRAIISGNRVVGNNDAAISLTGHPRKSGAARTTLRYLETKYCSIGEDCSFGARTRPRRESS